LDGNGLVAQKSLAGKYSRCKSGGTTTPWAL